MTAPTQATSTGWYYADGDPSTDRNGWDGRLWPEVTGYRGHDITVVETVVNGPVIDEPVVVEEPAPIDVVAEAEALTKAPPKARVKPPRLFEVVELKNAAAKAPVEIPEVREPLVSEGVEPAVELAQPEKGSLGLYLALALILIVIALILGVAL